jgi:hypothetical protein
VEDKRYYHHKVVPDFPKPLVLGVENNNWTILTPKHTQKEPETCKTLEYAEIAAAKRVYEATTKAEWKKERGIIIYKNSVGNEFVLSNIITQNGEETEINFTDKLAPVKRGNYTYTVCGIVHSHPTDPPYVFANEFSGHDYYESLKGYDGKPLTFYLVINVGENGTLIKFTPPNEEVSTSARDLAKKNYERSKTTRVVIYRKDKIEFVNTMLKEGGELKETPITAESIQNNTLGWKRLSPEIVLWKSAATEIIVSFENNGDWKDLSNLKKEMEILELKKDMINMSQEEHKQLVDLYKEEYRIVNKLTLSIEISGKRPWEDSDFRGTYDGRKFMYDLKNTESNKSSISKVIIKDDIGVRNITTGQPEIIGYWKFGGYIDALGITKDKLSLYVPEVCCETYRKAQGWRDFKEILPLRNWETL